MIHCTDNISDNCHQLFANHKSSNTCSYHYQHYQPSTVNISPGQQKQRFGRWTLATISGDNWTSELSLGDHTGIVPFDIETTMSLSNSKTNCQLQEHGSGNPNGCTGEPFSVTCMWFSIEMQFLNFKNYREIKDKETVMLNSGIKHLFILISNRMGLSFKKTKICCHMGFLSNAWKEEWALIIKFE